MDYQKIQKSRIQLLNDANAARGQYVLYWMQQSQRADHNHALEYAIQQANRLGQGVLVAFGLMDDYPEANRRHYTFMLEGLKETRDTLARRGIKMVIQKGAPDEVAQKLGRKASLIVCDCGYLRHQKAWRVAVACNARRQVVQVEGDAAVPVDRMGRPSSLRLVLRSRLLRVRSAGSGGLPTVHGCRQRGKLAPLVVSSCRIPYFGLPNYLFR